jgi:AbrB family looped-hinge helix DNA binding protein
MNSIAVPISSKGQITIPKAVRELLGVELGQFLRIVTNKKTVTLNREPTFEEYCRQTAGFWGSTDPAEDIRRERDSDTR